MTVAETTAVQPPFPPFHGCGIFNVNIDSPPRDGETEEDRAACINRNINHAQRRANEATLVLAEATRNDQLDSQGRPRQLECNLDDEFVHVDGHDVYKTPSANLAMAANELARLLQTPDVTKVAAMIKAAHCQVNEIRQDQRPSYSTSSIHRSAAPRSDRCPSRFTDQHHNDRQPLEGGARGNRIEHPHQHD